MKKIFTSLLLSMCLIITPTLIINAKEANNITLSNEINKSNMATHVNTYLLKAKTYKNGIKQKTIDTFFKETKNVYDNSTVEFHEMTTTYTIPDTFFNKTPSNSLFTITAKAATQGKSDSDKTGTIKCKSTITYTITKVGKRNYIKLTKANGALKSLTGFSGTVQGSGISIASNKVSVGCGGTTEQGKVINKTHSITCSNKPCSWTYSPNWPAVLYVEGAGGHEVGCTQTVQLKRGNSTWSFRLPNHIK